MDTPHPGSAGTSSAAVDEVLTALRRRGPDGLDALVASLEAEEDVHDNLVTKIRAGG